MPSAAPLFRFLMISGYCVASCCGTGYAGEISPVDQEETTEAPVERTWKFQFENAPWREVIKSLAEASGMALHVDQLPTGSFTYTDPDSFSPAEAIDRINLFLLPQGYTLVQSGKLMSLINLGDPRSMQQLDAIARLVKPEELSELEDHDVVKCIFTLGELKPEEAIEEFSGLKLITAPVIFNRTNRMLITETAGKLRSIKSILDDFQPDSLRDGTVVKNFPLQHMPAEDILAVIRPHLGLATGEMIGIDVSLSADIQGKNIFVTGTEDRIKVIDNLVKSLDQPKKSLTADGKADLVSHPVDGGNLETIYNVLQTLMAGKEMRLSMDEDARSIVALASSEIQEEIKKTITELQASGNEFTVIELKTVDPYFAVSLIEEMLDLPGPFDDLDEDEPKPPKIDADPGNMRLFVSGKPHEIKQIEKIVEGLDAKNSTSEAGIRLFPLTGKPGFEALETAAKFWQGANPIIFYGEIEPEEEASSNERVVQSVVQASKPVIRETRTNASSGRLLTRNSRSQAPLIRCQMTARGLLLQCEDAKALDEFEEHLRAITGPGNAIPSPPVTFYLKYTKANDAIRMLAELLDGGDAAKEGGSETLVNGYVSFGTSYLGSLVTNRQGTVSMTFGSMTVVADSRLNRLIAQGTAGDIDNIETYLKIIDKDRSITEVQVYGTARIIELYNTDADEIAGTIRAAFAGRVQGGGNQNRAAGGGGNNEEAKRRAEAQGRRQREQRDDDDNDEERNEDGDRRDRRQGGDDNNRRGDRQQQQQRGGGGNRQQGGQTASSEPKMTISVHESSNSLIVTAPETLFAEVEKLARKLDERSEETFHVLTSSAGLQPTIQQVLTGEKPSSRDDQNQDETED